MTWNCGTRGVAVSTLIMRETNQTRRTAAVRGGDALAAFRRRPARVEEEEAEPLHLRSHGTLCSGSFRRKDACPAARHWRRRRRGGAVGRRRCPLWRRRGRSQGRVRRPAAARHRRRRRGAVGRRRRHRRALSWRSTGPAVRRRRRRCRQKPAAVSGSATRPRNDAARGGGPPPQKAVGTPRTRESATTGGRFRFTSR